mmetsp:Transcript_74723/g.178283  ORF Transcript_74723/g.178283 Transcript_74723/m.178283 type:complete len:227 (+) Transcript_74723:357-1037(+)
MIGLLEGFGLKPHNVLRQLSIDPLEGLFACDSDQRVLHDVQHNAEAILDAQPGEVCMLEQSPHPNPNSQEGHVDQKNRCNGRPLPGNDNILALDEVHHTLQPPASGPLLALQVGAVVAQPVDCGLLVDHIGSPVTHAATAFLGGQPPQVADHLRARGKGHSRLRPGIPCPYRTGAPRLRPAPAVPSGELLRGLGLALGNRRLVNGDCPLVGHHPREGLSLHDHGKE